MNRERWAQIKDVFVAVVEQPSAQRQSALNSICQGDADLQAEILDLLRYHQEASHFLTSPAAESTPTLLEPGELLAGRYRIQAFLGSGGMAEVYEAEDCELGACVALKVMDPCFSANGAGLHRFRREVHLARQVTHPNVCRVFDIGHDQRLERPIVFLTMELIRGESLAARLQRIGRLPPAEAFSLALQLCHGLGAAHDAGVLHRDFKPGNVLLFESQGQIRASITDFGIARALSTADALNAQSTGSGEVWGTPAYMSPEQLTGRPLTLAADIYSLGLVLYEMITGVKPFGESVWMNVLRRLTEEPVEPLQLIPALDPRWNHTILRCLRRDPGDRFRSASEIAAYLTDQSNEHQHGIQASGTLIPQDYWKHHSPFRSLQVFEPEDAWLFFGRDSETAELMSCLGLAPMLAVVGNSGSGKSSLIRAGLIPALRRGHFQYEGSPVHSWRIAIFRPSASPFDYLAEALPSQLAPELTPAQQLEFIAAGRAQLPSGGDALRNAISALVTSVSRRAESEHILLVVDEFEEIFTLVQDRETRQNYIDLLLAACRLDSAIPVHLVIALRADFYANCLEHANLGRRLTLNQYNVPGMNSQQLGDCIRKRLALAGAFAEPGLIEALLADVGDEPGDLALLEHALGQLWEKQCRAGRTLTNLAYAEIGRLRGALGQHADDVYDHLAGREQQLAQRIFLELVHLGEGAEDTRRRVEKQALLDLGAGEQVGQLLAKLASSRLIATGAIGEQTFVEISHEALIRAWPRLREWLSRNREDLCLERHLRESAEEWQKLNRDPGALLQGLRLAEAEEWLRKHPQTPDPLRDLIQASGAARAEAARKKRETQERIHRSAVRFRCLAYALTGLFLVTLTVAWLARQQQLIAESRALAAQAAQMQNQDQPGALNLALRAQQTARTLDASLAIASSLPQLLVNLQGHTDRLWDARFSPDGRRIVTASWDHTARIWNAATGQLLHTLQGHSQIIGSARFSPDGQRIVTASWDHTARVWNVATGQLLHTLQGHSEGLMSARFSPDGQRIVTASYDRTARLWNAATGQLLATLQGHSNHLVCAVFSPDSRRIVTAGYDQTARIWNAATGQLLHTLQGHSDVIWSATFSPDGQLIVTASEDHTARVWNVAAGQLLHTLQGHSDVIWDATFSLDGQRIATASADHTARVWNAATGQLLHTLQGHGGALRRVEFSPDGGSILTASGDNTARLWDTATGQLLGILSHSDFVSSAVFSPNGQRLLTASWDHTARVWNTRSSQLIANLGGHSGLVSNAAFSPDGQRIVTASHDHTARVWNAAGGQLLRTLQGHSDVIWSATFSPDGRLILTASDDQTARVWNAASGQLLHILQGHSEGLDSAVFSPDGRLIVTASWDHTARVWNAASGQLLHILQGHSEGLDSAVFSPDGRLIVTASCDHTARVWDAATGQLLATLQGHSEGLIGAVFSPDGQRIVTAGRDHTARVWNAASGQLLRTLQGHSDVIWSATFSPDGQLIVTASDDQTARVWNAASGQLLHTLQGHSHTIKQATFSPDGQRIVTVSWDRTARVWNAITGQLLAMLPGHTALVTSAVFSPDGQRILTASADKTARLFRLISLSEFADLSAE